MAELILITGPARSGKSELAETIASKKTRSVVYVATAEIDPEDKEWAARIALHRQRRPSTWQTLTVPRELPATIKNARSPHCLLIDSLGTWVANLLSLDEADWQQKTRELLESLTSATVDVILVGEETGWGVVPAYESGRLFRDRLGYLTRKIGILANKVYLVAGGHALDLKVLGTPLEPK